MYPACSGIATGIVGCILLLAQIARTIQFLRVVLPPLRFIMVSHAPLTCSCLTADGVSSVARAGGPVPHPGEGPGHPHRESIGERPHVTATLSKTSTAGGGAMTPPTRTAGDTEKGVGARLHKGSAHGGWLSVVCACCPLP